MLSRCSTARATRRHLLAAAVATAVVAPVLPVLLTATPAVAQVAPPAPRALGYDRIGVRRGDTWHLKGSLDGAGGGRSYRDHVAGWQPVAGDFDGDGNASVSLFRDGYWRIRDVDGGAVRVVRYGQKGDQPIVGDWNGDGVDTIGLFRSGRWFLRSNNGVSAVSRQFGFGQAKDVAVVGDWNGNGSDDIAVRRGTRWYQRDSASGGLSSRNFLFGNLGDLPFGGDWDHDGKDTPGLFRAGTWFFRRGSFPSPYQTTRLGQPGDRPVIRRTQGLAPGVTHEVVGDRSAPFVAHVATIDLAAASSPETVLSQDRLQGADTVSAMVRQARAVLGINGDFFLGSGRPVHLYANDGRLGQTPTTLGRAFSLDASGTRFAMGYPDVRTKVTVPAATPTTSMDVKRWNNGYADGNGLSGYSAAGALLETPPDDRCYAALLPAGARAVRADGSVHSPVRTGRTRCGGARPVVPVAGSIVAGDPFAASGAFLRSLPTDSPATLSTQLGFPGAVDALGGNPLLVVNGSVVSSEVDGSTPFFARAGRTAVGHTADGKLLLVVVDGRQSGYSRGMTLRELAELMSTLGAHNALNLDGGGSSEMVVNGLVASRPSDGRERLVANALVVLPGADRGQADLQSGLPASTARLQTAPAPLADSLRGGAATDPASTGGLADTLLRQGVPVSPELRRTAELFRAAAD